ncbi:MAG: DNA polymerase IV [Lachnospiraceae bacterium]|nr:DNA polymerase IV [Lachnospiraceae bacterium]
MAEKIIFHIDVNNAFLSWESVYRMQAEGKERDLRTIASAIGGDKAKRHGIILAKSMQAKKYKVQTGEPIVDALRKCPHLVIVPPRHEIYLQYSEKFMNILKNYSPDVERFSVDEAFVDMTGTEKLFGKPRQAAECIKKEIYDTLGFTVNVGISNNKLLAKMASDFEKPDKVHTLFPEEIQEKMWPLSVRELFFVGKAAEKKLNSLGIYTIGDLARTDKEILQSVMKKQGETIWNFANGKDVSFVEHHKESNKGYGNSTTLSFDVSDVSTAQMILLSLAENIGRRLRKDGVKIEMVSVGLRFFDMTNASHQCILEHPTNITDEIHQVACQLLEEFWDGTPVRLIGIQTGRVTEGEGVRQLSMFDNTDYEKLERLDKAMDSIRERFGSGAVKRASLTEKRNKPL